MSPILVRPVREQLEHDRVVRALQAKLRRKHEVLVNMGAETGTPVRAGRMVVFPDLVLMSQGRTPRLAGVVEVETGESVNNLEALAQWAHFARAKVPFSLYVPAGSVDMARRLCADNQVAIDEIWTFFAVGTQLRFTLAHRAPVARSGGGRTRARSASASRPRPAARKGAAKTSQTPAGGRSAKAKAGRSVRRPAPKSRTAARRKTVPGNRANPARSRKR